MSWAPLPMPVLPNWIKDDRDRNVYMLSIDIAVNKSCDMSKHKNISFFAALIMREVAIGIVCCSPRETWTSAREYHVQGSRASPVRFCGQPWASQYLIMSERKQQSFVLP